MDPKQDDGVNLSRERLPGVPLRTDSKSEFALCVLFERYIPGWKPIAGETFQIPISNKRIDFMINKTLVEFHPIMINRELKSNVAGTLFRQMYKRLNTFERGQMVDLLVEELAAQYSLRRWQLIQQSEYRGAQFVVCRNEFEVYKQVICRFSPQPPKWGKFQLEFTAEINRARGG